MAKRNYINNVTQKSQIKKKIIKWSYLTLLNSRTDHIGKNKNRNKKIKVID